MKSMDYKDVITAAFYGMIALILWFVKSDFTGVRKSIEQLNKGVQELNITMVRVTSDQKSTEKRVDKNEMRIEKLELLHIK